MRDNSMAFKALFISNLKIIYRYPQGLFWIVFMPAALYIAVSSFHIERFLHLGTVYSTFLLPGIIALTIMQNGFGKKTSITQFPKQGRGGQGVKVAEVTAKTGKIAYTQIIPKTTTEVIITSQKGQIVKLEVSSIPELSRATQGVILMRFSKDNDHVASAACIE